MKVLRTLALTALVAVGALTQTACMPGQDDPEFRAFSGTVTHAPYYPYYDEDDKFDDIDTAWMAVDIDGVRHWIADIEPQTFTRCGRHDDGEPKLARLRVAKMLPEGTKVTGVIGNKFDEWDDHDDIEEMLAGESRDTPQSFLHVGDKSVSPYAVKPGWMTDQPVGLDLKDKIVNAEHLAVVAAVQQDNLTVFCQHAQDKEDERERERHRRERRAAARAAKADAAWQKEFDRRYLDDDDDDDDRTYGGGGYSTGGTPNYCPPGGCH